MIPRTIATLAVVALLVTAGCAGSASTGQNTDQTPGESTAAAQTQATTETPTETPTQPESNTYEVTVVRLIDGDTYRVKFPDGHQESVSLIGVDVPTRYINTVDMSKFKHLDNSTRNRSRVSGVGWKAHDTANTHLLGEMVTITTVPSADKTTDENGNKLVYLTTEFDNGGESLFQNVLLGNGTAITTDTEHPRMERFKRNESLAKENDRGLWSLDDS